MFVPADLPKDFFEDGTVVTCASVTVAQYDGVAQVIVAAQIVQEAVLGFLMAEVCHIASSYEFTTAAIFLHAFGNLESVEFFLLFLLSVKHQSVSLDVENLRATQFGFFHRVAGFLQDFPRDIGFAYLLHYTGDLLMAHRDRRQQVDSGCCDAIDGLGGDLSDDILHVGGISAIGADPQLLIQGIQAVFAFFLHPSTTYLDASIACLYGA